MSAILTTVLAVLSSILPLITASGGAATGSLGTIITALGQIIPIAIQEAEDVVPLIQSLIAEISSNATVTPDQVAAVGALSAQIDASFEAAAKADGV